MADFNSPPVNDKIIDVNSKLSPPWEDWFTFNWQNLVTFLSSSGVFLPQLTTVQRNAITPLTNGQMIYNTTLDAPQMVVAGVWKTIVTI